MDQTEISFHKLAFDQHYAKSIRPNQMVFPLEDVDQLNWGRGSYANEYFAYMYRRFTARILSMLDMQDGMSVLVLGCGAGADEKNLKSLFPTCQLWSIDISTVMVEAAVSSGSPSIFAQASAERLPFPDACFDRVISREVIEHVMSPEQMMAEVKRVLKPGGIAVVTTENEESLFIGNAPAQRFQRALASLLRVAPHANDHGVKDEAPTVHEVRAICQSVGLTLEDTQYDGALYKTLPRFQRTWKRRDLARLADRFSRLEGITALCDQVKFKIRRGTEACPTSSVCFTAPGTNDLLAQDGGALVAPSGASYPIRSGIPHFEGMGVSSSNDHILNEPTPAEPPVGFSRVRMAIYWRLSALMLNVLWTRMLLAAAWCLSLTDRRAPPIDERYARFITIARI